MAVIMNNTFFLWIRRLLVWQKFTEFPVERAANIFKETFCYQKEEASFFEIYLNFYYMEIYIIRQVVCLLANRLSQQYEIVLIGDR